VIVLEAKRSRKAERSDGVGGKEVWRKTAGDDLVPKQVCLQLVLRLFFVLAFCSSGIYTSVLHMHKRKYLKKMHTSIDIFCIDMKETAQEEMYTAISMFVCIK